MSQFSVQLVNSVVGSVQFFVKEYVPSQGANRQEGVLAACSHIERELSFCDSDRQFLDRLDFCVNSTRERADLYLRTACIGNDYTMFDYTDASNLVYRSLQARLGR